MKRVLTLLIIILCPAILFADNELPKNYPGKNIIGKGYNVFGEFANNKSIQPYPLFDFSKMSKSQSQGYQVPNRVFLKEVNEHIIETVEGHSVNEYITNLSNDVGLELDAFVFQASFDKQFTEDSKSNSEVFYYTYMDLNTKWQISLDSRNIDTLKNYLDPQFEADLANMDPASLFKEYGTHFISSAYIGGRIDYSSTTFTSEESQITEIKTAIKGKYKALSGEISDDQIYDKTLTELNTTTRLSVVGGSSEFTRDIQNNEQYEAWAASLNSKPALCGFDRRSLKPIWLLCATEARAKELEDYFNSIILPKHPLPIYFHRDPVLDNNSIVQKYCVFLDGFKIIKDCDYPTMFNSDGRGEFQYKFELLINGAYVDELRTPSDRQHVLGDGDFLTVNNCIYFDFDFNQTKEIKIIYSLVELGSVEDQKLGDYSLTITPPFNSSDFYNTVIKGEHYYNFQMYYSESCHAEIFFRFEPIYEEEAVALGGKGWDSFLNQDYDKCLEQSKKALDVNQGLWFAQFNVALVYLIQGNPSAYEKYKYLVDCCTEPQIIEAAYKDIIQYEKEHGQIEGSDEIKILLKSNF